MCFAYVPLRFQLVFGVRAPLGQLRIEAFPPWFAALPPRCSRQSCRRQPRRHCRSGAQLAAARGRSLQCNPTFWLALAAVERKRSGAGKGARPSYDFAPHWHACFSKMGYPPEVIDEALRASDWVDWEGASKVLFGDD